MSTLNWGTKRWNRLCTNSTVSEQPGRYSCFWTRYLQANECHLQSSESLLINKACHTTLYILWQCLPFTRLNSRVVVHKSIIYYFIIDLLGFSLNTSCHLFLYRWLVIGFVVGLRFCCPWARPATRFSLNFEWLKGHLKATVGQSYSHY